MSVNTRNPYMFRSFLFDHPQGAICRALCRYCTVFCWFAFIEYLFGMWPYVYIIYLCVCVCVCLVLLSVEDLFVNCFVTVSNYETVHKYVFHWQQHQARAHTHTHTHTHTNRWYTHAATYHGNIQRRKSAEDIIITAQSTAYGPLRMVE